jgi:hypothetical protein
LIPLLIPGAILTLLTTGYFPTTEIGFQYSGHFIAYMFPAAAVALWALGREPGGHIRRRAAGVTLAFAAVLGSWLWGAFSPRATIHGGFTDVAFVRPSAEDQKREQYLHELLAMVPRDARIAVSEREMPHVSRRLNVFTLRDGLFDAEYLLYEVGSGFYGSDRAEAAKGRGEYIEVARRPGLVLLKRAPASARTASPGSGRR